MVVLITGASHAGKTYLAQKMLEEYRMPYVCIDHLKMGLIRSGNTHLTPEDDAELTGYLWPIVREMIKTAIENGQDLIVEGCYVPFDWRKDFDEFDPESIRFVCLAMTDAYIETHFDEIIRLESVIEKRKVDPGCSVESVKADNRFYREGFERAGEEIARIDADFDEAIRSILEKMRSRK